MILSNVRLAGNEVLSTGTIIGRKGDTVDFYPFLNNPAYCLRFLHRCVSDGPANQTNIYLAQQNLVHMELTHKWAYPNELTVVRTIFANDDRFLYGINYYIQFLGELEVYTFLLNYTIFSEASS